MEKTLVVYFGGQNPSQSTMTKVAKEIAEMTGADLFEIKPVHPYSKKEEDCVNEALRELDSNARPGIVEPLPDLAGYSTVILGFPNWCGTAPMPVFTFLDAKQKNGELAGKRVVPFVINAGSGQQNCITDLKASYPEAALDEGSSFISGKYDSAIPLALEWAQTIM